MEEMKPEQKLAQIQTMALAFHRLLIEKSKSSEDVFRHGGDLFLGKFYANSPYIYFGLNPGTGRLDERPKPFRVDLCHNQNAPFEFEDSEFQYWKTWKRFLGNHPHLYTWFNDRVTSTFLCPWRTPSGTKLERINTFTGGSLYIFAGDLIKKMIEHHRATLIVVASRGGFSLLKRLLNLNTDTTYIEGPAEGPGWVYQWRKAYTNRITILQIPHFSWAVGLEKLIPFAQWLTAELRPFGLNA